MKALFISLLLDNLNYYLYGDDTQIHSIHGETFLSHQDLYDKTFSVFEQSIDS